jgi:WXG100 family type VII secretion target
MPELLIPPTELHQAAEEFSKAKKETEAIIKRLEKTTSSLEDQWGGATQQVFYKHYKDWMQQVEGFNHLLGVISQEMHAMADRFEDIDT